MPKEKKGRAAGTLNRHLSQLQEVLVYIAAQGNKIPDFTGVSNLRAKQTTLARNQRNPFSPEDLISIFRQPPWTGCAGLDDHMCPGPEIYHDATSIKVVRQIQHRRARHINRHACRDHALRAARVILASRLGSTSLSTRTPHRP